jgi:regulator of protease activity HflC (stomatin/prohibitin superfamily)
MKRFALAIATAALSLGLVGCSQIDTGNVGVIKTGGQYKAEELTPGWHFTLFSSVTEVSTKENAIPFNDLKPKTADQITVEDLDIDIYYQMNPSKAQDTMVRLAGDLAKNSDGDYVPGYNYVSRTAREAIYTAMSTVNASEAQVKRASIPAEVQRLLQAELDSKFEKGWFTVTNVNLRDLTVSKALEAKIRQAAQVDYEIDAKKKQVTLADEEAKRLKAVAQGEADAAKIKADALASTQGSNYLRWVELQNQAFAIQKWNGVGPVTIVGSGGAVPLVNVSGK